MKITILAAIGSYNLGDELILKNEIYFLQNKYSELLSVKKEEIHFSVFSYDISNPFFVQNNVVYYEYFPIGIKKVKNIFRNIKNFLTFLRVIKGSDRVIVGGGGIFFDNEYQSAGNPLTQILFRLKIAHFFKKKIEIFRVGINIKNSENYYKLSSIIELAETVSLRDSYSYTVLEKMGFDKNISLEKDPVFFDKIYGDGNRRLMGTSQTNPFDGESQLYGIIWSEDFSLKNIEEIINSSDEKMMLNSISGKTVGIALRQRDIKNYDDKILEILKFLQKHSKKIVFIPHSFHPDDEKADDYIWLNNMKKSLETSGNIEIEICTNMQESYSMYRERKMDFVFSQRLHSIILSQVYSIPFLGISYSKKTREIIEQIRKI